MSFPGMSMPGGGAAASLDPEKLKEQQMVKMVRYFEHVDTGRPSDALQMQVTMESCVGKSALSGVMGFGLGGVFGLFMSSVGDYAVPMSAGL